MCIMIFIVMLSHCAPPAAFIQDSAVSARYQGMVGGDTPVFSDDAREDWVMKKWFADVKPVRPFDEKQGSG